MVWAPMVFLRPPGPLPPLRLADLPAGVPAAPLPRPPFAALGSAPRGEQTADAVSFLRTKRRIRKLHKYRKQSFV